MSQSCELSHALCGACTPAHITLPACSEDTPEGRRITKLDQILLNGNNITMLVPGSEGPQV